MTTFQSFGLNQAYLSRCSKIGDRLSEVGKRIDWSAFRLILETMYSNQSSKGGHPNVDVILMFKIQLLEFWHFLGCPDSIPDNSTIWLFRERMSKTGVDKLVWAEFQRQLDLNNLKIEMGMIQVLPSSMLIRDIVQKILQEGKRQKRERPYAVIKTIFHACEGDNN